MSVTSCLLLAFVCLCWLVLAGANTRAVSIDIFSEPRCVLESPFYFEEFLSLMSYVTSCVSFGLCQGITTVISAYSLLSPAT